MQHIRTQPAGPKAFRLYSLIHDTYRREIGERVWNVYEALTYYVDPKTLQGTIPLKLLAETVQLPATTVRRHLQHLWQQGFITITPQWDAFGCVRGANLYVLHARPIAPRPTPPEPTRITLATPPRQTRHTPRLTLMRCSS